MEREAELVVARDLALESSRAKSAFLANISHEIRTPMNGLLGVAQILATEDLDDHLADLVGILNKSGKSMMDVLNQILDFTDLEAGRHQIDAIRCSPARIVETVVAMFDAAARVKGLTLTYDIAQDMPERILAAPRELTNIMMILVSNAIKFTDEGTIDMALWYDHPKGQSTLYFSITDTGPGIPPEAQDLIFSAFNQIDSSASRQASGVGLGLAVARRTARLLGGDISVESTFGKGSRFFLAVPVKT
jgi:signal transduction histidine kinase